MDVTSSKWGCENTYVKLECKSANSRLNIVEARYGIFGSNHTRCQGGKRPDTCSFINVGSIVSNNCSHAVKCDILAHGTTFNSSDPCLGLRKFLNVSYKCIDQTTTTPLSTRKPTSVRTTLPREPTTLKLTEGIFTKIQTTGTSYYSTTPIPTEESPTTISSDTLGPGVIAGIAVGGLLFFALIALIVFLLLRRSKTKKNPEDGAVMKQNEIYEMNGAYERCSPDLDDSIGDYAIVNDKLDHVTSHSQPPPDNVYSYADQSNHADTGQAMMTDNILYGTQE